MITNNEDVSLPLAVWLIQDDYDYNNDPKVISTTSLLKPLRELILSRQHMLNEKQGDISTLIPSRIGSALHDAIERSWTNLDKMKQALKDLGYPDKVISQIKVNPKPEEITPDTIPIYLEQRVLKDIGGYTVSGKYDLIFNGRLKDIKSTGTYTYQKQTNKDKYIKQGSIYRWQNPDKVTDDSMDIEYIFTDWSKLNSIKDATYPKSKLLKQSLPLMGINETESFIKGILYQLDLHINSPQEALPRCTDEELWIEPSIWKYYKDPNKTTRSTKNFTNSHEAMQRLVQDGSVGIVKEIKGTPKACNYCSVAALCDQRKEYVNQGLLNPIT